MRTQKRNIFCLFFLLYAFAYAASPLIFTLYCESQASSAVTRSERSFATDPGGSPVEDGGEILVADEESPSESSAFWLLVKKKRALVPDDTGEEELQPDGTIIPEDKVAVSASDAAPALDRETVRPNSHDHHPLSRSNSPPSASSFLSC